MCLRLIYLKNSTSPSVKITVDTALIVMAGIKHQNIDHLKSDKTNTTLLSDANAKKIQNDGHFVFFAFIFI